VAAGADTPRLGDDWMVEALRVPRSTTNLPRNRRIPFVRIGRRIFFMRAELIRWVMQEMSVPPRRR